MSSTDIVPFAFDEVEVRTIVIDGEPWFVASDIASVLGHRTASDLARSLDDDEKGTHGVRTPGGEQYVTVINEAGLFRAIVQRRTGLITNETVQRKIKAFQRWVTHDLLPQIRRTGAYQPADDLALPTTYLEALEALVVRERTNVALTAENAQLTPRAIAWDAIASAEGDYSVGEAAKILVRAGVTNLGPTRLFQRLHDLGWTYRGTEGTWMAYADRIERGHLAHKPQFHYHPRTRERVVDPPQLRVTLKGIELLRQRLGGTGTVLAAVSA